MSDNKSDSPKGEYKEWNLTASWNLVPGKVAKFSITFGNGQTFSLRFIQGYYVKEDGKIAHPDEVTAIQWLANLLKDVPCEPE